MITDEIEAKNATVNRASSFLEEVKKLLNKIESDLAADEATIQMNGAIHAMALNDCLLHYTDKVMEIFEIIETKGKLN